MIGRLVAQAIRTRLLSEHTAASMFAPGTSTRAGVSISEEGALRVSACWIATTLIADEIATLPGRIVSRTDTTRQTLRPPELAPLYSRPNPDQTIVEWRAATILSLLLWGAAYVALSWSGQALTAMVTLHPARCRLERRRDGGTDVVYESDDGSIVLEAPPGRRPDVMVIRLFDMPGVLQPVSPVRMAAELLGLAAAYDRVAANLAGRGLAPTAVLTYEDDAADPQRAQDYATQLAALHGGPDRAGRIIAIGGKGVRLERLTWSPADVQLVAQSERLFGMVMALWRVPPTVAGIVDKPSTWGTGMAELARGLERFTLRPIARRFEAAVEDAILAHYDTDLQYRLRFDALLSASPVERAQVQQIRVLNGMTSIERVLAQEDEPPFAPGETVLTPLNVQSAAEREESSRLRAAQVYAALIKAGISPDEARRLAGVT